MRRFMLLLLFIASFCLAAGKLLPRRFCSQGKKHCTSGW